MSLYHHKKLAYIGLMSQSKRLTSLTPTPTYVHNSPLGASIPARTDLHFKFVFGDADCLESRFEYIVVRWRIPQRGNTLKVVQKATSAISSKINGRRVIEIIKKTHKPLASSNLIFFRLRISLMP